MLASSIPTRFPIPFAFAAGAGFTRPVPEASQISIQAGAASLTDGFPPVNFSPIGAGGTPPFGADMNGLLNQITLWNQWQAAGAPVHYDSGFATAIGGYPEGALLPSASVLGKFWISTADDNSTDPDGGGAANWSPFNMFNLFAVATGSANAIAVAVTPNPASLSALVGMTVRAQILFANTTTTPQLLINSFGGVTIVNVDGSPLFPGQLSAGGMADFVYDGTNAQLISAPFPGSTFTVLNTAGSGSYATKAGCRQLKIRMIAGSGGSGCADVSSSATDGGSSSFNAVTVVGGKHGVGSSGTGSGAGGLGGTGGTGSATLRIAGARGGDSQPVNTSASQAFFLGGYGASSPLGGGAGAANAGVSPPANSGAGASGGASTLFTFAGGGGSGSGEYAELSILNPTGNYAWIVGAAGTASTAGGGGLPNGAAGSAGQIIIEEVF